MGIPSYIFWTTRMSSHVCNEMEVVTSLQADQDISLVRLTMILADWAVFSFIARFKGSSKVIWTSLLMK